MFKETSNHEHILHENYLGIIVQCKKCKKIAFVINNLHHTCNLKDFQEFYDNIQNVDYHIENYIYENNGKNYVVINTDIENINLVFNLHQFEQLTELFFQSKHMIQIHKILSNHF